MAERVSAETVRSVLGIVGREALRELVKAVGEGNVPESLELLEALLAGGKDVKQIITELAEYLRAVLLYKASPEYREIYLTDTKEAIAAMEGLFSTDRLMAAQERLHQCMLELRQSVRGRIAAEMCLFDLCRVEGSTLAALTARVEKLEAMLAGRIPAIQQTVPAAPVHQDYPQQAAAAPETGPKFGYVLDEGHGIHTEAPEPQPQKAAAEAENYQPAAEPVKAVPVKKAASVQNAEPAPIMEADAAAEDLWQQVLEILKTEKKRSMVACAAGGRAVSYVNGILTVAFKNKFNCKRMNADDYKKAFEAVLGMANMQGMMKKVQKMQQDMLKMQEELKNRTVEATAGGGAVTVVVTGRKTVEKVTIAPSAVDPEDVEMLEDLVTTAINEAMRKVDEMTEKEMGKITGGMKLPGMF